MTSLRALLLACFILLAGEAGCPQTLSTLVLPSEDELIEALNNGEIDYSQYVILLDLVQQGIDSSDYFLLEEIPNLSLIQVDSQTTVATLENDQAAAFVEQSSDKAGSLGSVNYRYLKSLEQDKRTSYRLSSRLNLTSNWRASFQVRREYSGRERWTSRSVRYSSSNGFIRRLTIGTFNARLGLGTVYGYRGKLVSYSDQLDGESFLYPDYGGFNGFHSIGMAGKFRIEGIGSVARDDDFSLASIGGALGYQTGKLKPSVVVGISRLANRVNGESIADAKLAFGASYDYSQGYSKTEVVTQIGHGPSNWSAVAEGKHRFERLEIRYAGWSYANGYLNLTGGGKSASIYGLTTVQDLEFDCSDRRAGQSGGQIRTALDTYRSLRLINSAVVAARDGSNRNVELLNSAQYTWTRCFSTQIDYLTRNHRRAADGDSTESSDRRWRLETRIQSGKLALRTYIAYTWDSDDGVYTSAFVSVRSRLHDVGTIELWSNFGRIRSGELEYWYLFVRLEQALFEDMFMGVKFAHVYRRGSSRSSQPSLSLELKAQL